MNSDQYTIIEHLIKSAQDEVDSIQHPTGDLASIKNALVYLADALKKLSDESFDHGYDGHGGDYE